MAHQEVSVSPSENGQTVIPLTHPILFPAFSDRRNLVRDLERCGIAIAQNSYDDLPQSLAVHDSGSGGLESTKSGWKNHPVESPTST